MNFLKDVGSLILGCVLLTRRILHSANKLKIVARACSGYKSVDLKAATERKEIIVTNVPDVSSEAVAS